jgi:hypothetical protein
LWFDADFVILSVVGRFESSTGDKMKQMNHTEYPKSLRGKTASELRFIAKDAKEAIDAMPTGENVGYYADEICYVVDELYRRREGNIVEPERQNDDIRRIEIERHTLGNTGEDVARTGNFDWK